MFLADRGARVHVDDFQPPPPLPKKKKKKSDDVAANDALPIEQVVIRHPDRKFDLVLAWEHGDFVPPDRLSEFAAEVSRVLAPGGWLLLYAKDDPRAEAANPDPPACYRLTAEDRIVREPTTAAPRPRWTHPNRRSNGRWPRWRSSLSTYSATGCREFLVRKPDKPA